MTLKITPDIPLNTGMESLFESTVVDGWVIEIVFEEGFSLSSESELNSIVSCSFNEEIDPRCLEYHVPQGTFVFWLDGTINDTYIKKGMFFTIKYTCHGIYKGQFGGFVVTDYEINNSQTQATVTFDGVMGLFSGVTGQIPFSFDINSSYLLSGIFSPYSDYIATGMLPSDLPSVTTGNSDTFDNGFDIVKCLSNISGLAYIMQTDGKVGIYRIGDGTTPANISKIRANQMFDEIPVLKPYDLGDALVLKTSSSYSNRQYAVSAKEEIAVPEYANQDKLSDWTAGTVELDDTALANSSVVDTTITPKTTTGNTICAWSLSGPSFDIGIPVGHNVLNPYGTPSGGTALTSWHMLCDTVQKLSKSQTTISGSNVLDNPVVNEELFPEIFKRSYTLAATIDGTIEFETRDNFSLRVGELVYVQVKGNTFDLCMLTRAERAFSGGARVKWTAVDIEQTAIPAVTIAIPTLSVSYVLEPVSDDPNNHNLDYWAVFAWTNDFVGIDPSHVMVTLRQTQPTAQTIISLPSYSHEYRVRIGEITQEAFDAIAFQMDAHSDNGIDFIATSENQTFSKIKETINNIDLPYIHADNYNVNEARGLSDLPSKGI